MSILMHISSPNPIFDNKLESSIQKDSNKWSNKGFGEEIRQAVSIEVYLKYSTVNVFVYAIFERYTNVNR